MICNKSSIYLSSKIKSIYIYKKEKGRNRSEWNKNPGRDEFYVSLLFSIDIPFPLRAYKNILFFAESNESLAPVISLKIYPTPLKMHLKIKKNSVPKLSINFCSAFTGIEGITVATLFI